MLDEIFEFIVELILEGTIEISKNRKISKLIRCPLVALLIILFGIVILGIFYLGIFLIKENIILGMIFIGIGLFLLIGSIKKFQKIYIKENDDK